MLNNFTDSSLNEALLINIDKAKLLVEKVNSIIPDDKIKRLIDDKKGNYFLYEDLLKNSKILLNGEKKERKISRDDENSTIINNIDQINENFIVHEIQGQLEEILISSVNLNKKSIFKDKLKKILNCLTKSENSTDLGRLNYLVSSAIDLVEVLLEMNEFVEENFFKSCQMCERNLH